MTIQTIMLRRGSKIIKEVPAKSLIPNIRSRKLLGTDEISVDGEKWVRLDKHHQLGHHFVEQGGSGLSLNGPTEEAIENKVAELARLLKEINGG